MLYYLPQWRRMVVALCMHRETSYGHLATRRGDRDGETETNYRIEFIALDKEIIFPASQYSH